MAATFISLVLLLAVPHGVPPIPAPSQHTDAQGRAPAHWPQFRGPRASGVADGAALPLEWNVPQGKGVKWKTPIAGLGHSAPIIWGDSLFVTAAVRAAGESELKVGLYGNIESVQDDSEHEWRIICLDKSSGQVKWDKVAHKAVPRVKRHTKASHVNSTPATDGRYVVAILGSEGLWCYTVDGEKKWHVDLGPLDSGYYVVPAAQWGFASSPVIHDDMVIVQCDVQEDSYLAAFDINDGRRIWRTRRDEVPTWGTPTVYEPAEGRPQIIVNGYKHIGAYELASGEETWKLRGGGDIPVPTPVIAHGLVYITNAHGMMAPIYAVKLDAGGDITPAEENEPGDGVAWWRKTRGNYMQTPLVYGDYLYCCNDGGILTCYQAQTGETVYRKRLGKGGSGFTASAVAGDGKVYFTSEDGDIYVVKAGPEFEVLATNGMGEVCMATPAISDGVIFFRTRGHVVAIER